MKGKGGGRRKVEGRTEKEGKEEKERDKKGGWKEQSWIGQCKLLSTVWNGASEC